jgi:methylated-DNA-[protein]-cysteine S-methyltransferase
MADLRWWRQPSPYGDVTVVVSDAGVREITLPGDIPSGAPGFASPPVGSASRAALEQGLDGARHERDDAVATQLDEWFAGTRESFDLVLDLDGIDGFRRDVLDTLVREVPWGETVSYGELAGMAGRPRAARGVGRVMATNPLPFVIPCHRVLAAGGRIGGYGSGRNAIDLKRALLAREGAHPR